MAKMPACKPKIIVLNIAHREKDHVTLGEEGLDALRLILSIGRREHSKWLKERAKGKPNSWDDYLCHADKYVERQRVSANIFLDSGPPER